LVIIGVSAMSDNNWQLTCKKSAIVARAELYNLIRDFFKNKQVLEVETPVLSYAAVTDPYIDSFEVTNPKNKSAEKLYLQTSPEFAMKRLLCSDLGSIFQICKSFRSEEIGKHHHVEFSMLEWYRLNFKLEDLMAEMAELLCLVFEYKNTPENILYITYRELFIKYLDFDYNLADIDFLKNLINKLFDNKFDTIINNNDFDKLYTKDDLLMILISNYIEPRLDINKFVFIYNFPESQSALARIDFTSEYPVAKRFEVYYNGLELANGFYELACHNEQLKRFDQDLKKRESLNLPIVKKDHKLLAALASGLPECSGVALGLDRLLMLKLGLTSIEDVLAFRF